MPEGVPASAGTAYVSIRPDFSALNAELARKMAPLANQFGERFGKALGPVMAQQSKHLRAFTTGAKYAAAGGAALAVVVGKDLVQAGMKFEKQMSVNAAISEANRKQLARLERQSIQLGKATFYSASEAAEAQGELIKGGLTIQQVLGGGLPAALHLAEAGQLELAVAAETTVNAMKLFELQGKEAGSVADMLSTAANKTTADVLDFAMAMKQGGSVSKLAGYDMNETVTVLEALAEAGIKNSDAGTSLKTSIIQLLKPSTKQAELAKELNLHFVNQEGHLKSASGLSKELRRATEDMTKAERAKTLATLAGTDGVRTLNALYAESPKQLEALERANAKQGTAQEIARKKMDNLAGSWEQFKGSLETGEILIYKGMAPALTDLADEATKAANRVSAVFENENLDGSEKAQRAVEVLGNELSQLWDRYEVSDHLIQGLDAFLNDAVPHIAEGAGKLGLEFSKGFVKGFTNADFLGKVVMASWALHFIGGKAPFIALGKSLGKQFGFTFAEQAAVGAVGAGVASNLAGAAITGSVVGAPLPAKPGSQAWLGSGAQRGAEKLNAHAAAMGATGLFGVGAMAIPNIEREMLARGQSGGKAFWRGWSKDVRGRLPQIKATTVEMGSRLARGAATWGLGGVIVGELSREIAGGSTGDELAAAFQGAGAGAAIGSAIAPGVGTALGATLGGAGGLLVKELEGDHLGDQYAEDFVAAFEKKLPHLKKALTRMDFGEAGRSAKREVTAAGVDLVFPKRVGGSGLRGAQAELREQLAVIRETGGSEEALAAVQQKLELVNSALRQGEKAVASYSHGFDVLKSGVVTRMGDISKITQEDVASINQVWKNNPPKWHQAMAQSMKASVAAIHSGIEEGVIETDDGQKRIKQLMRNIRLFEGRDPLGLAEGFSKSWAKAGQVNSQQIQAQIRELNKMPKGAREAARDAMVGMARKMESEGKLVKGSASRLNSALTTKFGQTNKQLEHSTAQAMAHVAGSVADGATNVGSALSNIFDNLANALAAVGSSKIPEFSLSVLSTAAQYHHAREGTESGLRGWHGNSGTPQGKQTGGFIVPGSGSGDIFKTMVPAGSFVENREAVRKLAFQAGGMVPVMLEPGERVHYPEAVKAIGKDVLEARNGAVPRFQSGGLVHPKLDGPDPVRTIGQAAINQSFKAASAYLRKHMEPQRVLKMLRFAEREAAKGFPYVYGGGHGSFSGPYDCSGFVSAILHAGGFLDTPMSVQQGSGLYTLGQGGPGKFFTWGVRGSSGQNAHTMMSIKAPGGKWKYFEAGGSGGGAHQDSGWDGSFQFRHMPGFQRGGEVPKRAREAIAKYGQKAFDPESDHFVGWGYRLGGLVQELAKGGWVKTGYTTYDVDGPGAYGDLMKGKGYAELGSATAGGAGTGAGFIAKVLGRSGELPKDFPLEVKIGSHAPATLYKRDRGYGQGDPYYSIDIHHLAWPDVGLSGNSKGNAFIRPADGSSADSDEHSFKEDIPAVFEGAKTGDIGFPSVPKNLKGIERELDHWQREARTYRKAKKAAEKANRPGLAQAIGHNIAEIENHLRKLRSARHRLRFEEAKKAFSKKVSGKLGRVAGYGSVLDGLQREFERASQDAEQIVALEPQAPELPASATDALREGAEKAYVQNLTDYVGHREQPAYEAVLGKLASLRNAILKAETFGFGKDKPSVSRMESTAETKIYKVLSEIESINQFSERTKVDLAAYKRQHPNAKGLPDWLKKEVAERDKKRGTLPFLRFQDQELRKLVGELRGSFFPGGDSRITPPTLPMPGSGELEDRLRDVQGLHWPDQHELLPAAALKPPRTAGKFGGSIWDVQSSIEELGLKITQASNSIGGGGSADSSQDNSELLDLERQMRIQAEQRFAVSEKQRGTIEEYLKAYPPYVGRFHDGGVVPGPPGTERTAIVQPQERIRTPEQELEMAEAIRGVGAQGGGLVIEKLTIHSDGSASARIDGQELRALVKQTIRGESTSRQLGSTNLR